MKKVEKINSKWNNILIQIISDYIIHSESIMNVYESSIKNSYLLYICDPCKETNCLAIGISDSTESLLNLMITEKNKNCMAQELFNSPYDLFLKLRNLISADIFDSFITRLFLDTEISQYPKIIQILSEYYEKLKKGGTNEN